MNDPSSAAVIQFARVRAEAESRIAYARLRRALAELSLALAGQRVAVAQWRLALAALDGSVGAMRLSLRQYGTELDGLDDRLSHLREEARRLERLAATVVGAAVTGAPDPHAPLRLCSSS